MGKNCILLLRTVQQFLEEPGAGTRGDTLAAARAGTPWEKRTRPPITRWARRLGLN